MPKHCKVFQQISKKNKNPKRYAKVCQSMQKYAKVSTGSEIYNNKKSAKVYKYNQVIIF